MTVPAFAARRIVTFAAWLLLPALALTPRPDQAQQSAAAAITHSANSATLSPAAMSAVLNATSDCSHQPFSPDKAFQVSAAAAGAAAIRIDWKIADGCYLYRSRIKVKPQGAVQLGALALPEGENHHDEYFGTQQIYHHSLSATLPVSRPSGGDVAVDVTYQGCAEIGLCYPPITKTVSVSLPPAAAAGRHGWRSRCRSAQISEPR